MKGSRESKGIYVGIDFTLAGEKFSGLFRREIETGVCTDDVIYIGGKWESKSKDSVDTLNINTFLERLNASFRIPEIVDFNISEIGIVFINDSSKVSSKLDFQVCVDSGNYGKISLLKIKDYTSVRVEEIPQRMYFHNLPIIGQYFEENSFLGLDRFGFTIFESKFKDLFFKVVVGDYEIKYGEPDKSILPDEASLSNYYLPAVFSEKKRRYCADSLLALNDSIHWMDIDKTFGPVRIVRLGIGYSDGLIAVGGDVDIKIACLTFYIVGLSIGIPFGLNTADTKVKVNLDGLGINFTYGKISIVGEILKDEEKNYTGLISVRVTKFGLTIMGTYKETEDEEKKKHIYLFAFGALHMVLGGPPCFVVTGLSVGLGLNKKIILPEVNKIKDFPLIQAAMGDWKETDPTAALRAMKTYITDQDGNIMYALGITFNTFQMIDSCLIGMLCLGNENQIALMGQSYLQFPKGIKTPFVNLGIGVIAAYNFDQGILEIKGAVSEGSYVFAKDCKLTGGFAWYMWFKGKVKGDFVLTVGGYHKDFRIPDHYPLVDKVGVNWVIIKNELTLQGDAYMALTPSCFMAGGSLNLTYVWDSLSAWVRFKADTFISWLPFHYEIEADASIGASYTFNFFGKRTVTLETSVKLHIWGPDFSLQIYVKWYIISFTIEYINDEIQHKIIQNWTEFSEKAIGVNLHKELPDKEYVINDDENKTYVEAQISNANIVDEKYIVKNASPLIELSSKIPITSLYVGKYEYHTNKELGVLPMGEDIKYDNKVTIKIYDENHQEIDNTSYNVVPEKMGVPYSLWGRKNLKGPSASIIDDVITAVSISFKERTIPDYAPKYSMSNLAKPVVVLNIHNLIHEIVNEDVDPDSIMSTDYSEEKETINKVVDRCKAFCAGKDWKEYLAEMDVGMLAEQPENYFIGNLMIKEIGKKGEWNG